MSPLTYREAGVDLEQYQQAMARLPHWLRRTFCPRVIPWEGGFAGLFRLDFPTGLFARRYRQPVLVAGADGVGTKIRIAQRTGRHHTIGIDLVAMCVNDVLCCGAEPLFFLDYVAMARDDPQLLEQLVRGISDGCVEADCALLGGETAVMPGLYRDEDYDLAGFCVGVVEQNRIINGQAIQPGDAILGLASSGIHSNGYSLVRRIVFDHAGLDVNHYVEELGEDVGTALLRPTRIYARTIRTILRRYKVKTVVRGIAHITGGGLPENLQRILPPTVDAVIDRQAWPVPPVFPWLQRLGEVETAEMYRVFNMGIGMVLVVRPFYAPRIQRTIQSTAVACYRIGEIVKGSGKVRWKTP